jgi:UMF1 family MFS transporter
MTDQAIPAPIDDRREIFGWTMYDWAVSAFSTTVAAVFFGPYLTNLAEQAAETTGGFLYLGNIPIKGDSLFAFAVSASVLLQVSFFPLLGALADYSRLRKTLLMVFSTIGALATIMMFFITEGGHWFAAGLFILANLAFGASVVFYNAYLPVIASPDRRDHVSASGFGLGYLGGGLLLLINLAAFLFHESLGLTETMVIRINLASAGVWWLGFSFITFRALRSQHISRALPENESYLTIGFTQLANLLEVPRRLIIILLLLPLLIPVLLLLGLPAQIALAPGAGPIIVLIIFIANKSRTLPEAMKYLVAYLLYNDGIQTVIALASVFAAQEIGVPLSRLALVILMIQFVAFGGAFLFSYLARTLGTRNAIILSLVIWSIMVIFAFLGMKNTTIVPSLGIPRAELEFWVLGAVIAVVLGGSQALSRSLFAQMIPKNQEAEFFSFYEVSERGTSWMGTFIFGVVNQAFGSLRLGILSVIFFFLSGLLILLFVDTDAGIEQAAKITPATSLAGD